MRQKHVLTALAIFVVTGAVSVPNSLAVAWRLDVGDRHVGDRGELEWNPLIHTVGDIGESGAVLRPNMSPGYFEHQTRQPERGAQQDTRSDYSGYGSSNNYSQKESSGAPHDRSPGIPSAPFSETIYGQLPRTPSADPAVRDLSR